MNEIERRTAPANELRASTDGGAKIVGYAARFNSRSDDLGGFVEVIAPGAFARALADRQDVRALFNHDPNYVIGRTTNDTLVLREDANGLYIEAMPPDTQWARDLITSIQRGDVTQMSFAFSVSKGGDVWDTKATPPLRTLRDVNLYDVSPVTYPAYEQTSVSVSARSALSQMQAAAAHESLPRDDDAQERERLTFALRIAQLEV
jgi:HK97 family phage prohead protease